MTAREPVRYLVFSATLRAESLNTRLARLASQVIAEHGGTVDAATMRDFDCPSYDQDVQSRDGLPAGAKELCRRVEAHDVPLEHLGAGVFPDMFSLAQAHQAFDANGSIANAELSRRFVSTIGAFMDLVEAAKHYPCVKKAWVEFLGEHPGSVIDRVE
jgi:chromate reductase, NAD(P)H dehydrogenase (quinone)